MIAHLGIYRDFAVRQQESEGYTSLHVVADEGRGQWDVFPLFGCRTFEDAKQAIDQWLAYEEQMNTPEPEGEIDDEDLDAVLAHLHRLEDEEAGR